ncbi:MAG: NAD(P)H-binding protein [Candidatus Dormibacteraeota bacterium]|nr:NAD(P)H-binding protein [Candidatus Dormibacteraeota bacterium]
MIGVLGATGRTGRAVLGLGLARGLRFRCLVRAPHRLGDLLDHVEAYEGDSLDESTVARLTHDCQSVISVIGHVDGSPADLLTRSARNVLISRPNRLVWLTGAAVDLHGDRKKLIDEIASSGVRLFARRVVRDSQDAADLVNAAATPFVIVRAGPLSESPARGTWRISSERLPSSRPISRLDLADFLLKTATEPEPEVRTPFVSY